MERYVTSDTFTYVAVSVNCEESYEYSLATGRQKVKPGFKLAGKLVLLTALRMARRVWRAGR